MHRSDEIDVLPGLLPLRGLLIEVELLSRRAEFPFAHELQVGTVLRLLLGSPENFHECLLPQAIESGRGLYWHGARYRFGLLALPSGEHHLHTLLRVLEGVPFDLPGQREGGLSPGFMRCRAVSDHFSGRPVTCDAPLSTYGLEQLRAETAHWRGMGEFRVRLRSPLRLLRRQAEQAGSRGIHRFCRAADDLDAAHLLARVSGSLARNAGRTQPPLSAGITLVADDLFWVEPAALDTRGAGPGAAPLPRMHLGGLFGSLRLVGTAALDEAALQRLVLGQYLGIGQGRAFGLGRYVLEDMAGHRTAVGGQRAMSLLEAATNPIALDAAWARVLEQRRRADSKAGRVHPRAGADPAARELSPPEELYEFGLRLRRGTHRSPAAARHVIASTDGRTRLLEVPGEWDRVAQRAVVDLLAPALEAVFHDTSYGYRRGRSRDDAAQALLGAMTAGRSWVVRGDIADCFESIDLGRVAQRLETLYDRDPLVAQLLTWLNARRTRDGGGPRGLPQGSPLSPVLANLVLTDLDEAMMRAGWPMLRFADDLAVPCTDRSDAERALAALRRALGAIGLRLRDEKTCITNLDHGFRFLGLELSRAGAFVPPKAQPMSTRPSARGAARPTLARTSAAEVDPRAGQDGGLHVAGSTALPVLPPEARTTADGAGRNVPTRARAPVNPPRRDETEPDERPDELPVLCVFGEPVSVHSRGGRVVIERAGSVVESRPWRNVAALALFGRRHRITTPALMHAFEAGVPVHFALDSGRYMGVAWHAQPDRLGMALWAEQSRCFSNPDLAIIPGRSVIGARIRHQRELLRQWSWDDESALMDRLLRALRRCAERAEAAPCKQSLRTIEGRAGKIYFGAIRLRLSPSFGFERLTRRPALDPLSALLCLGYTLLRMHVDTLVQTSGLAPRIGFLHADSGRHSTLSSDLMEPFRHLVERVALRVLLHGSVLERIHKREDGSWRLEDDFSREYCRAILDTFAKPRQALGEEEAFPMHLALARQTRALLRFIREPTVGFEAWRTR